MIDTEDDRIDVPGDALPDAADPAIPHVAGVARPLEYAQVTLREQPRLAVSLGWNLLGYELGLWAYIVFIVFHGNFIPTPLKVIYVIVMTAAINAVGFSAAMLLFRPRAGRKSRALYAATAFAGLICGCGVGPLPIFFFRLLFRVENMLAIQYNPALSRVFAYLYPTIFYLLLGGIYLLTRLIISGRPQRR